MIATSKEKEILRDAGKHLGVVLLKVAGEVRPGISTAELNDKTESLIREYNDSPAFLNYSPEGAPRPFPAALCTAVNDVVVHGISTEQNIILKDGDIIGLDAGLVHKGFIVDSGLTVPVGNIDAKAKQLLRVTKEALYVGIEAAKIGNTVGDIGYAIEQFVKPYKYGIVRELCGHGVGRKIHEEPSIPNFGKKGEGQKLVEGMVIAIEPMLNEGSPQIVFDDNWYTVRTEDGSRSAHFEHTIIITKNGPEIITEAQ